MGLDILLVYKKKEIDPYLGNSLSRRFCNFLCGPDAYSNCEFEQIQEIHKIDLSILRRFPNIEPNTHELDFQIYLAEEENDQEKVKQLKKEVEKVTIEWENNYNSNFDGWTKIEDLEEVIKKLLEKINQNPSYHEILNYNFDWADYFQPQRIPSKYKRQLSEDRASNYVDNILTEDLNGILKWINSAKEFNIKYVGFDYG